MEPLAIEEQRTAERQYDGDTAFVAGRHGKEAIYTNIVFWFYVVVTLVAAWFLLSFMFKSFGKFFLDLLDDVKRGISDEDQTNENEEEN